MPFAGHAKSGWRVDVTGQLGGGRVTGEHDTLFDRGLEPMFGERSGLDALAEISAHSNSANGAGAFRYPPALRTYAARLR
jgi:hypothetical protein